MLSSSEQSVVISALVSWAKTAPDEPVIGFMGSGQFLTPNEILSAVTLETDDGKAILEIMEHGVRREGLAKLVERLTRLPELA